MGSSLLGPWYDTLQSSTLFDDKEPPRKRARLETVTNDHDLIPIARISLASAQSTLQEVADATVILETNDSLDEGKEVSVIDVLEQAAGQCTVTLSRPGREKRSKVAKTVALSVTLSRQELGDLQRIASIEKRARDTARSRVVRSRCLLRRARNTSKESETFLLEATILWPSGASALVKPSTPGQLENAVLLRYYGIDTPIQPYKWDTRMFYDCVHAPPLDEPVPSVVNSQVLATELFPFQKRAVGWMLRRERAHIVQDTSDDKSLVKTESEHYSSNVDTSSSTLPLSYKRATDADGNACFYSASQATVARRSAIDSFSSLRGGILAEEMGLGKTCEIIALICLHRRSSSTEHADLKSTGATLIVTPPTILQQWKDEISRHAPQLRWMHYEGIASLAKSKQDEIDVIDAFSTKDIVITTYPVLAKEVHFAVDPPDRNLRRRQNPSIRKRSPLVQMHWWRVCLDEAQMVESGVSAAAQVAVLIPRINAWAVSGTPLKKDVQDLRGLLVFLQYRPYCDNNEYWKRLVHYYREDFESLFNSITLRHTKDKIRHELKLPPQRRVTITVPFTAIEEQNYKSLFAEMAYDCGCTEDGSPLHDQWNPNDPRTSERMRSWLLRLRQSCLHPQIGGRNRQALGRGTGPLRTVGEVLEIMIDQTETTIRTETRQSLLAQIQRAHIFGNAKDDHNRAGKALEILLGVLTVAEARAMEAQKALAQSEAPKVEDAAEVADNDPAARARLRLQANVRTALELQHACDFFVGTAYFQIKSNEELTEGGSTEFQQLEEKEVRHYEKAKVIRRELLKENTNKVDVLIKELEDRKARSNLLSAASLADLRQTGGIESRRLINKIEDLADIMSAQTRILQELRDKIATLLCKPLVDREEEEIVGDEYEESTKQQDELYCYVDAFRAMVADRLTCLNGQVNILINHEMSMLYKEAKEERGHSPALMIELLDKRKALLQPENQLISLRGLVHETRSLETTVQWHEGGNNRAEAELRVIQSLLKRLQAVLTEQTKVAANLEKDQELFRTAMNQRLEYYRQLQQISDSVAPYKEELDETLDQPALDEATKKAKALDSSLAILNTKLRFLLHLREESSSEGQRICVICQCHFEQGVLTVCGHQYCKDCIQHWWRQHRTCPVCKRNLRRMDFHAVSYKPRELQAQQEELRSDLSSDENAADTSRSTDEDGSQSANGQQMSIYSDISPAVLNAIKSIDLPNATSYGTKIDTISRHLLYLRESEPGVKTVIFSQYRDFLAVLSSAFSRMSISHVRIQQANSITRFREDPSIEAFLLDAKTDSSGLNLVNATHVMLCEPLVNAAIELQAIARVHRIGQRRPTSVWMYLVKDTVEESIYELSVKRRLEHVQASSSHTKTSSSSRSATPALGLSSEAAVDAANSLELQQAPLGKLMVHGKGEGELVAKDDLWNCLFGKSSKNAAAGGGAERSFLDSQAEEFAAAEDGLASAEVSRFLRADAAGSRVVADANGL